MFNLFCRAGRNYLVGYGFARVLWYSPARAGARLVSRVSFRPDAPVQYLNWRPKEGS